ncbi:MAG: O-antigen ligase family protein, partial [Candidatus Lokiarchaeota archaeon]|nr:O-antigen ligase family protein [Candidatus Lokiarchaeota archaeon]
FYAGLASLIFLGILFTYTRMALLSTVIGFIILSLSTKRLRKYIFMVIILLPIIIPSSLHQRFSLGLIEDYSMIIRYLAWHKSVILIKENLLGIGFNSFAHLYQNMVPLKFLYAEHSHNVYLRFMLELGILGFLAYFYMIISILRSFYFAIKTSSYFLFYLSLIISIIVILIACITDVFIARYSVAIYFWLIMGLMNKLRQIEISNESIT